MFEDNLTGDSEEDESSSIESEVMTFFFLRETIGANFTFLDKLNEVIEDFGGSGRTSFELELLLEEFNGIWDFSFAA